MWSQRNFNDSQVMWQPSEQAGAILKKIQKVIEDKYDVKFDDYWDFHKWTVDHIDKFWGEMFSFFEVIHSKKFDKVIDLQIPMSESPSWFEGARLNYAENLLKYRDNHVALLLAGEDREPEKVTYAEMYEESKLYAAAFREFGLKKDDIVVCYMSNRKEAVFAMHAVVSIGAIWTGALPLIGAQAVLNRFQQVKPKVLLTVDRFRQEGEEHDMLPKVQIIAEGLPSLQKVIIVPSKDESKEKDIKGIRNSCFLEEFLHLGRRTDGTVPPMEFEQVSFSHPVFLSYTSGTTGPPKAMVHGSGVLLGISLFYSVHGNSGRDTVRFSVSPMGWASWTGFTTLHFLGCTLLLYEGSPYFLSPTYLWDLVDELKITNLFLPSSVLDELEKRGYTPKEQHSLSSLAYIMAAGSIVKPQSYDFVNEKISKDVLLSTGYGSTELMGACMVTELTLPVRKGEISSATLGTSIECVDDSGTPVLGAMGELIITKPLPFLTLGLWGDSDGSLYREKYFSKYPGRFAMGDYGIINPVTRGYIICCRSDETLKQRGCRFGSSEIYNIVEKFTEVRDSLCVSHYNKNMDEKAVLFLKIRDGHAFSEYLVDRIRKAITRELTERHVPDVILETKDIPYNMNGKKMEIIVKKIINKMPYSPDTISNQESLKNYFDVLELQEF